VPAVLLTIRDVTERKRIDVQVRENEERLRRIADVSFDTLIESTNGLITYITEAGARRYGYAADELLGKPSLTLIAPEHRANVTGRVANRERGMYELEHLRKDGTRFPVEVARLHFTKDDASATLIAVRDITERKLAEEQMRRSEERLRHIAAACFATIIEIVDGRVAYITEAGAESYGYAVEKLIGAPALRLVAPEHVKQVEERLRDRHSGLFEVEHVRKDGSRFPVEITAQQFKRAEENIRVIAVRDITERRRIEADLRAAKERAEAANRAKSEFLAVMSHEIRTPMNGVLGMAGILCDTSLEPQQRDYVDVIRQSGKALLAILNDILDFSKMEAGRLDLEDVDFPVHEVVESVASLLGPDAHRKGLALSIDFDHRLPKKAKGDPGRLRQILINLVGNAIKFTETGSVAIDCRVEAAATVDGRSLLRFAVADTGIGIAADDQARLFSQFTQVDSSTTRRFGGTGLGLAICKQLVQMMGGEIGVDSAPGSGSIFWFTARLGAADASAAHELPKARTATPAATTLRILVAEDNSANQKVAVAVLTRSGHAVDVVGNGIEAVNAVRAIAFDLVMMDLHMPEMDGISATRAIRAFAGDRSRVPIVAMTADALGGARERCLEAGMNDYISKPIDAEELHAAIARFSPSPAGEEGAQTGSDSAAEVAAANASGARHAVGACRHAARKPWINQS
jgi:PAS domain S-box-containing protein